MAMKKTELEKRKGLKVANALRQSGPHYDTTATAVDRREQRERDRAAGLVPFAVKLPGERVRELHELAQQRQRSMNDLVDELLPCAINKEKST
jgi:hypothetical protein